MKTLNVTIELDPVNDGGGTGGAFIYEEVHDMKLAKEVIANGTRTE